MVLYVCLCRNNKKVKLYVKQIDVKNKSTLIINSLVLFLLKCQKVHRLQIVL